MYPCRSQPGDLAVLISVSQYAIRQLCYWIKRPLPGLFMLFMLISNIHVKKSTGQSKGGILHVTSLMDLHKIRAHFCQYCVFNASPRFYWNSIFIANCLVSCKRDTIVLLCLFFFFCKCNMFTISYVGLLWDIKDTNLLLWCYFLDH